MRGRHVCDKFSIYYNILQNFANVSFFNFAMNLSFNSHFSGFKLVSTTLQNLPRLLPSVAVSELIQLIEIADDQDGVEFIPKSGFCILNE